MQQNRFMDGSRDGFVLLVTEKVPTVGAVIRPLPARVVTHIPPPRFTSHTCVFLFMFNHTDIYRSQSAVLHGS